jgi:excisionase family DNA binding protein
MEIISKTDAPALISAREAASRLGLSIRSLRTLVKERSVATVRIRGRVLFAPEDLQKFIESRRVAAAEQN